VKTDLETCEDCGCVHEHVAEQLGTDWPPPPLDV
jgi:hypothetical protein